MTGFAHDELYYIRTRGPEDKRPMDKWGGYGQDFSEAPEVFTHDEVVQMPDDWWAVVGVEDKETMSRTTLIFDLDVHKAPDDFDVGRLDVAADTLLTKSQNGGFHLYFTVHGHHQDYSESDFEMTQDLGWDIDIRGSAVGAHVVAPTEIPGVDTPYEVVQNQPVKNVLDPADAAERIRCDGEPLLKFNPDRGYSGNIDIDRDVEPPAEMPTCYHRGLQAREANPDDADTNTHKVNVLTALCGLSAGYDVETMVGHFCDDYAPGENADRERTEYQLTHIAEHMDRGDYSPPALSSLRDHGILDEDETCDCDIPYHGKSDSESAYQQVWEWWSDARKNGKFGPESIVPEGALYHIARERELYDFDALPEGFDELPDKAHNKALAWINNRWPNEADVDTDEDGRATDRGYRARDLESCVTWEDVRYIYDESKEDGRRAARTLLSTRYDLMTVEETDSLRMYDPDTGVYTDETGELRAEIYDGLKSHWSTHELNEVLAGLRQHNIVPKHELNGAALDGPHICVENGVLDLLERELKDHSPDHYFTDRVPVTYDPDADTAPHEDFVDELVEREEDKQALFEMVGHALTPDANERWKKFLILTGDADNGKSAFYGRVKALLDGTDSEERNTSAVKLAKMAQNRFSVYSMHGSMANIAGEIDGKKIRNTAAIKDIPGGDPVELEPKGGDSFFDTVNTTLMFAANDPPIIGERDKEAIATRIVPVELPYTFTDDPDPDDPTEKQAKDEGVLEDELDSDEARSGFLNLALDGIERLESNGGDVSIPEPPEERLRMYERSADPMREFGERCLSNEAADYVVKADVTTVYKEFATAEGYELGSNVGSVLHDVLRGVPGLNYTESRKRTPDYAETDLPLRAWDERKFVVDRVTLTEEGLKYADSAGLIDDEDPSNDTGDLPLSPSDVSPEHMEKSGRLPVIEATVTGKHTDRFGNPSGHLRGDTGGIDYTAVSLGADELPSGATVRVVNAKLATTELGAIEVEIDPTTEVVVVDAPDDTDDAGDAAAATDGGGTVEDTDETEAEESEDTDEYAQPKPKVRGAVADAVEARGNKPAPTEAVLDELEDMTEDTLEKTLEALKTEGAIQRMKGGWIPT